MIVALAPAPVALNGFARIVPLTRLERCAELFFQRGEWEYEYLNTLRMGSVYVLMEHVNQRTAVRVWMLPEHLERMREAS